VSNNELTIKTTQVFEGQKLLSTSSSGSSTVIVPGGDYQDSYPHSVKVSFKADHPGKFRVQLLVVDENNGASAMAEQLLEVLPPEEKPIECRASLKIPKKFSLYEPTFYLAEGVTCDIRNFFEGDTLLFECFAVAYSIVNNKASLQYQLEVSLLTQLKLLYLILTRDFLKLRSSESQEVAWTSENTTVALTIEPSQRSNGGLERHPVTFQLPFARWGKFDLKLRATDCSNHQSETLVIPITVKPVDLAQAKCQSPRKSDQ